MCINEHGEEYICIIEIQTTSAEDDSFISLAVLERYSFTILENVI